MSYPLYDLEITTVGDQATYNCSHVEGQGLTVKGENVFFKNDTTHFSHYALASLLPFLAAKQRAAEASDWMAYDTDIACPDPLCGAGFRIVRRKKSTHSYTMPEGTTGEYKNDRSQ